MCAPLCTCVRCATAGAGAPGVRPAGHRHRKLATSPGPLPCAREHECRHARRIQSPPVTSRPSACTPASRRAVAGQTLPTFKLWTAASPPLSRALPAPQSCVPAYKPWPCFARAWLRALRCSHCQSTKRLTSADQQHRIPRQALTMQPAVHDGAGGRSGPTATRAVRCAPCRPSPVRVHSGLARPDPPRRSSPRPSRALERPSRARVRAHAPAPATTRPPTPDAPPARLHTLPQPAPPRARLRRTYAVQHFYILQRASGRLACAPRAHAANVTPRSSPPRCAQPHRPLPAPPAPHTPPSIPLPALERARPASAPRAPPRTHLPCQRGLARSPPVPAHPQLVRIVLHSCASSPAPFPPSAAPARARSGPPRPSVHGARPQQSQGACVRWRAWPQIAPAQHA